VPTVLVFTGVVATQSVSSPSLSSQPPLGRDTPSRTSRATRDWAAADLADCAFSSNCSAVISIWFLSELEISPAWSRTSAILASSRNVPADCRSTRTFSSACAATTYALATARSSVRRASKSWALAPSNPAWAEAFRLRRLPPISKSWLMAKTVS
jgi:hypothetical protein